MDAKLCFAIILAVTTLAGCKGGRTASTSSEVSGEEVPVRYAENLKIVKGEDYTAVTLRNPWDTTKVLQKYILVDREGEVPADLPQGTVVRVPVKSALVYSTVHSELISRFGCAEAIKGMCSVDFINDPALKQRVEKGEIEDCGQYNAPNIEKIVKLNPEVIILSPYSNGDNYARVGKLGIPLVECAEYMETSGLGRAEWMRFFGLLFGREKESEQEFSRIESNYQRLKQLATSAKSRPVVMMDCIYGGGWDVPGGLSTIGRLIHDAGGTNPFGHYLQSGGVNLSPERVLAEAHDADIWFYRYNQTGEKTLKELGEDAPIYRKFEAYRKGNVYGCNTRYVNFFEETPFHPDRLLEDMVRILHPEISGIGEENHYFTKLK